MYNETRKYNSGHRQEETNLCGRKVLQITIKLIDYLPQTLK